MKKTIGVCITRVQDELNRGFLDELCKKASERDYNVAVFHSIYNNYSLLDVAVENQEIEETGSMSIFQNIPFDKLCILVIVADSISDGSIVDKLIEDAKSHNLAVLMVRGIDKRCTSIYGRFYEPYRDMIAGIIKKYDLKDVFYLGGMRTGDNDTVTRVSAFKEALESCGLEFNESMLDYGDYWEWPTYMALERKLGAPKKDGKKVKAPQAIFCANDTMAIAVIDKLKEYDLKVPEDVLVTGFDGIESALFHIPRITTCREDHEDLARVIVDIVLKDYRKEPLNSVYYYNYACTDAGSSNREVKEHILDADTRVFEKYRAAESDEDSNNLWLDLLIGSPNMLSLKKNIYGILSPGRAVLVRQDSFIKSGNIISKPSGFNDVPANTFPEKMQLIQRKLDGSFSEKLVTVSEGIAELLSHMVNGRTGYFSTISVKDILFGIAYDSTSDMIIDGSKVNRYARTLNRALNIAISGERQLQMSKRISQARYIDTVTEIMNMDGLNKWYKSFVDDKNVNSENLVVGVYTFMTYQKIFDQYGSAIIEDCLQYIARALTMANPESVVLARISVDSFAIVQSVDNQLYGEASIVDKAVSQFYGFLDVRNKTAEDDVNIEVSCGYVDITAPWDPNLGYYISAATANLYKNRMNYQSMLPKLLDVDDLDKVMTHKSLFMSLIEKNLFDYHFQPIVDAKTANVVAYEALMRTPAEIGMSPLDVLATAEIYSKKQEIEHATFFNILKLVSENEKVFKKRDVFINTIPGCFLTDKETEELKALYGEWLGHTVVEITESETITAHELMNIKKLTVTDKQMRIAVDDYGTGHSNIVNLLEYKPQIVKIDRYLITDIDKDNNKQMFVKNTIDFAKANNMKVLAEGVETGEELKTVIEFGVHLIQGYYTARPAKELITKLPKNIVDEIKLINEKKKEV